MLDFYKCYRAYVRAKVQCPRLDEPDLSTASVAAIEAEARTYVNLARPYAGGTQTSGDDLPFTSGNAE